MEFESRAESVDEMLETNTSLITIDPVVSYLGVTESELDRRLYSRMTRDNASVPMRSQKHKKKLFI